MTVDNINLPFICIFRSLQQLKAYFGHFQEGEK